MRYGRHTAEVERLLKWLADVDGTMAQAIITGNGVRRARIADGELYGDVLRYTARSREEALELERDRKKVLEGLLQQPVSRRRATRPRNWPPRRCWASSPWPPATW